MENRTETETKGNGDNEFKGGFIDLDTIAREDGIMIQGIDKALAGRNGSGVLQRSMTAIDKDEEYRQELKTAYFLSTEEADKWVAAYKEAKRYGLDTQMNVDWLIARSAGIKGGRLHEIFQALTHTTFTTNYAGNNKKWWQNDKSRDNTGSPIA